MALKSPPPSLVKYDTPVLVTYNEDDERKFMKPKSASQPHTRIVKITEAEKTDDKAEILDKILKPREIEEDGHLWMQHVSSSPATTADVLNLQEQLDQKLVQLNALETDELIRQVTINCVERGLLLLRVRDEFRMTLEACKALYESSAAFGIRKELKAKQNKLDIETEIKKIKREIEDLKQQIIELTNKCKMTEQNTKEQNEEDEQKFMKEIQHLKGSNQQIKTKLEEIITSRK